MKKKKLLALGMVAALSTTAVVGGTLAYFTDSEAELNQFVVGDMDILLHEDFDDDKPLVPGDPNNAEHQVKKEVTIENKSTADAYVRLLIAYEDTRDVGAMAWLGFNEPYAMQGVLSSDAENNYVIPSNKEDDWLQITDGSTVYTVGYVTLPEAVKAGETTDPILKALAIKAGADNQWAEIVGEKYDVMVLAQGAQVIAGKSATESINTAFGFTLDEKADEYVAELFNKAMNRTDLKAHTYTSENAWTAEKAANEKNAEWNAVLNHFGSHVDAEGTRTDSND